MSRNLLLLRQNAWLAQLSGETLGAIAAKAMIRRMADEEVWISRHEAASGIALVVDGALRSTTFTPDGKEYVFSIMQKGEIWGLVSTIDGITNANDVYAYGDTVLLTLDRRTTLASMDAFPDFGRCLTRILCHRLRMANLVLEDRALAPLEVRLVRLLLSLRGTTRTGRSPNQLMVTQEMLSKLLGCTRPTVNRKLRLFERQALVTVSYGCIELLDVDAMQRISGHSDYLYF